MAQDLGRRRRRLEVYLELAARRAAGVHQQRELQRPHHLQRRCCSPLNHHPDRKQLCHHNNQCYYIDIITTAAMGHQPHHVGPMAAWRVSLTISKGSTFTKIHYL